MYLELDLADGSALQVPPNPLEGDLVACPWLRHHAREVGPVEGEEVQPRHRAAEGRARLHVHRLPAVPLRRVVAITALCHGGPGRASGPPPSRGRSPPSRSSGPGTGPYPRLVLLVVIPDALAIDVEVLRLLEPLEILNAPGTQEVIDVRHNVRLLLLVDEETRLQHALPEAQLVQDVRQSRVKWSAFRR